MRAAIVGIAGVTLRAEEAALLRAKEPAGVILFSRNIENPRQLASLVADLREILPQDAILMVDQEGGRVARLRPPHWLAHPSAETLGLLFERDPIAGKRAAWLTGALIGYECAAGGFQVVNAPVLDLRVPGAHAVIGDRAFSGDPKTVALLGGAMAEGLLAAGIQPVAKHIPGHGRAKVDSHQELPQVDASNLDADLVPFAENAHLPWAMTAHIVYTAFDPALPATLSRRVIEQIIRGRLGWQGVLISDDLGMGALRGPLGELAGVALSAGCDLVLHCSGELEETAELLADCPWITSAAAERLAAGRQKAEISRLSLDLAALTAEREFLLRERRH
ncbi:MAG: beta-N-acetylhexosaminidase [Acidobacteriia bacterium]|nr:beta-N-acetylhexosaminidase [Methyloceanibacter sp.]MCL6491664.1 beta-N-acetylhexosaminidase [Terriglobia bacterium]